MKQPLLSLDPAPETETGAAQEAEGELEQGATSPGLYLSSPLADAEAMPAPEPLLDPLTLSSPVRSRRSVTIRIPLSWVIMGLAGSALLLIGLVLGMKISDYYHGRYFENRFAKLFDLPELPPEILVTPGPSYPPSPTPAATPPPAPASDPSLMASSPGSSQPLPSARPEAAPSGNNPDFEGELAALRQERQLVSQRFEQLSSPGRASASQAPAARGEPLPGGALPSSAPAFDNLMATQNAGPQLSPDEQRIRDAPAIARVREYDPDWHFVVLDGGKERNIVPGTQLAVRRGHQILGLIRVDEVENNESVAELQGTWRADAQAIKPRRGDDVVTYPPF